METTEGPVQRLDRSYNGSLYNCGYTDGYTNNGYNPRWESSGETFYAISIDELGEYDSGYQIGKLNYNIDKKS